MQGGGAVGSEPIASQRHRLAAYAGESWQELLDYLRKEESQGQGRIIGARYVAIGLGDTSLYVMAGMAAALFLSLRFFQFKGARRAS